MRPYYHAIRPGNYILPISNQDVQTLKLADGTIRTFNQPGEGSGNSTTAFNFETQTRRNILWYYPSDLIFNSFTLAYERILPSGKVGLRVPLSMGFASSNRVNNFDSFRRNNRYETGLELNYYPFGQGKLNYYFGPAMRIRSYRLYYYDYSQPQPALLENKATLISLALKNGIYFQFNKSICISADVGLGLRLFNEPNAPDIYYPTNISRAYLPGNVHLGFRF